MLRDACLVVKIPHRPSPYDPWSDDEWDDLYGRVNDSAPSLTVDVTDNPVVATLYGPRGEVLLEWNERPPFGFASARM